MNPNTFPTKGNLMLAKNSLKLAKKGYELMDKKRNILIRELMELIDKANNIQSEIDSTFTEAYALGLGPLSGDYPEDLGMIKGGYILMLYTPTGKNHWYDMSTM